MDLYAKCSRCGAMVEGDSVESGTCFEAALFRQVSPKGSAMARIYRDDEGDSKAYVESYPLCPDCMKDTLEFVRGKA